MVCRRCSGQMKGISFLSDHAVGDKTIDRLKLTFFADKTRRLISPIRKS